MTAVAPNEFSAANFRVADNPTAITENHPETQYTPRTVSIGASEMNRLVRTAFVLALLSLAASSELRFWAIGQTSPNSFSDVSISGIEVSRSSPDLITVRYVVKNTGNQSIFIPCIELPSMNYIQTFSLLHLNSAGTWLNVQKRYDVPSSKAKVIEPGRELALSEELSDHALSGKSKIRLGYFRGATAWKARQRVLLETHDSAAMPPLKYAESDEFVIDGNE
jgi:hypothetical protein